MSSRVLEIVPPRIQIPRTPRRQRHTPRSTNDYRNYRACLRWDAGFTCCFCLVHESDLTRTGTAEGTGLTSIEHLQPQSHAPDLINVYSNCAYACQSCNNVRRCAPSVHPSGARLLDPWRDVWGEHVRLHEDRLEPLHDGDAGRDARYTIQVYRLNHPHKVAMRAARRTHLQEYVRLFEDDLAELRALAARQQSAEARLQLLGWVRRLKEFRRLASEELAWRRAIPADAPARCRCDGQEHHRLPPETEVLRLQID